MDSRRVRRVARADGAGSVLLAEGLLVGDLKGLVLSVVSIDRHVPKIGDEEDVVVLAFTVLYEKPAEDLAEFIERGAVDVYDVEVSEGPSPDGNYRVYVELLRDVELYSKVSALLRDVRQVTGKDGDEWTFIPWGPTDDAHPFNKENFRKWVIDNPAKYQLDVTFPQKERAEAERREREDERESQPADEGGGGP